MSLKIVAEFLNPLEAHIALGRLKAEGVEAYILHEHHVWANWMYSQALGGVKIAVPEQQLEKAKQVLTYYHSGEFADILENDEPLTCPHCASPQVEKQNTTTQKIIMVLTFGLLGWLIPLRKQQLYCKSCHYQWR